MHSDPELIEKISKVNKVLVIGIDRSKSPFSIKLGEWMELPGSLFSDGKALRVEFVGMVLSGVSNHSLAVVKK